MYLSLTEERRGEKIKKALNRWSKKIASPISGIPSLDTLALLARLDRVHGYEVKIAFERR